METYQQFNPILRTYKVHNFILVNKNMDKELIFKITRLLFQNKSIFNRLTLFETDKLSPGNLLSKIWLIYLMELKISINLMATSLKIIMKIVY